MSKIIIHYFTGTGNTAHAVKLIYEHLHALGHEVKTTEVKKDVFPSDNVYDYQIFAFPVLSWSAPVMMKKYIGQMSEGNNVKTAVLAINGAIFNKGKLIKGYTGQALEQIEKILKRKNYDVFLTGNASFPDNWTQMTNPCNLQDVEAIFPLGEAEVRKFIQNFLTGKTDLYRCGFFNTLWSYSVAGLFGFMGRKMLGKFYIADENCTGCGICANSCPAKTIKMNHGKPRWGLNCEDCNRCINICPERAIQTSLPVMIFQFVLHIALTVLAILGILTYIPQWNFLNDFFIVIVEIILIILAYFALLLINVGPVDLLIQLLIKIPAIRRFCSKSHTQKYRRYKAPGYNPLMKDL